MAATCTLRRIILLMAAVSFLLTTSKILLRLFHVSSHSSDKDLAVTKHVTVFSTSQVSLSRRSTPASSLEIQRLGTEKRRGSRQDAHQRPPASKEHKHSSELLLEVLMGPSGVAVKVDDVEVYNVMNKTIKWGEGTARLHAGVHLLTLHQHSGHVMRATTFLTWQPETSKQLRKALRDVFHGRLILLVATPEFTQYLEETTVRELVALGSHFAGHLVINDAWCLVVRKGVGVVHEALTTTKYSPIYNHDDVPSTTLHLPVPVAPEEHCSWYFRRGMEMRYNFCQTYDGYGDFCSCTTAPWTPRPNNEAQLRYNVTEVIPVAIVTANRLTHVLRQVSQIWANPGGAETPIFILVDGHNPEAKALAKLLNLPVLEHHNKAPLGTSERINEHVKWSLQQVFRYYTRARLAIILEDDLDLAKDFIPYFHQTASLMLSDPTLLFVNAYNYNSYNHTAYDLRRLYRGQGIPGYGWMTSRKCAQIMLQHWVPTNQKNAVWDWWLRAQVIHTGTGMEMLIPEVPRTRHMGGGGVHISGFDQILFSGQPLSDGSVLSIDTHSVEKSAYDAGILRALSNAHVVTITYHPCEVTPIPTHQTNRSYLIYIYQPDESHNHYSYDVISLCLGINDRDMHENYNQMTTFPFYHNQVYLVACPNSPYCRPRSQSVIYRASEDDLRSAKTLPFPQPIVRVTYGIRTAPLNPLQEFMLENRRVLNYTQGG